MPRFKADYPCDLIPPLKRLGMPLAFDEQADFSGITPAKPFHILQAMHKAKVDVDEKGTKAAATTAIQMGGKGAMASMFLVDRPFLFLIRDDKTGALLFMGVIVDPR